MSLLPNQSAVNPTLNFWGNGGGGGAVNSITAGTGINVDVPSGNVVVANTGVISLLNGGGLTLSDSVGDITISADPQITTRLGDVDTTDTITLTDNETAVLGLVKPSTFFPVEGNYYLAGATVVFTITNGAPNNYAGSMQLVMNESVYNETGSQTIQVDHKNSSTNYSISTTIGFVKDGGDLSIALVNNTGATIDMTYFITNFYCIDMGASGSRANPIFI